MGKKTLTKFLENKFGAANVICGEATWSLLIKTAFGRFNQLVIIISMIWVKSGFRIVWQGPPYITNRCKKDFKLVQSINQLFNGDNLNYYHFSIKIEKNKKIKISCGPVVVICINLHSRRPYIRSHNLLSRKYKLQI